MKARRSFPEWDIKTITVESHLVKSQNRKFSYQSWHFPATLKFDFEVHLKHLTTFGLRNKTELKSVLYFSFNFLTKEEYANYWYTYPMSKNIFYRYMEYKLFSITR